MAHPDPRKLEVVSRNDEKRFAPNPWRCHTLPGDGENEAATFKELMGLWQVDTSPDPSRHPDPAFKPADRPADAGKISRMDPQKRTGR